MTDHDLYQQILGLTSPWRVSDVELRLDDEQILVRVVLDRNAGRAQCPVCRNECPGYDTPDERRWRHLDTCQLKTYLVCSVPRVSCPEHGVHVAHVPWSEPNSGFTSAFEAIAIKVLGATAIQAKAASILRVSADQIHDLMHRAVARGLALRNRAERIRQVGIDEKAIRRGHAYMSVLTDTEGRRVLDMVEGRTLDAARMLLRKAMSGAQRRCVKSISMDMWVPFQTAQEHEMPQADRVHDRFHVAKYLGDAVDKTRQAEHARLSKAGDQTLSRTKYVWLKNPENMTDKQKALFETLEGSGLETAKVWAFKDTFREFFECEDVGQASAFFANWYSAAIALKNKFLTKVAHMLNDHYDGLTNYIRHRTTNASAEGINSRIQHIKASARGYRKFEGMRVAVLFHLGKLDLNPQKSL